MPTQQFKFLTRGLTLMRCCGDIWLSFNEKDIAMSNTDRLHTEKIIADRKTFYLDLIENARGKVIKITEEVSGNRDTIMVPAEILNDFIEALTDIQVTANE